MKKILIILGLILSVSGVAQARIKTPDLILASSFEELNTAGTSTDWSGSGRHGTIIGAVSGVAIGMPGVCKYFDGIDDKIDYGRIIELEGETEDYTICLSVQLITGGSVLFMYDQNGIGTIDDIYMYWTGTAVNFQTGNGGEISSGITDLGDGKKHRVVLVKTSTNALIYEDGALKLNVAKAGGIFGAAWKFRLGDKVNGTGWKGYQDELRIYKKALNEAEVRQDMLDLSPGE